MSSDTLLSDMTEPNTIPEMGTVGPHSELKSSLNDLMAKEDSNLKIDTRQKITYSEQDAAQIQDTVNNQSQSNQDDIDIDSDATIEYTPTPTWNQHLKSLLKKQLYYCQLCETRTDSVRELNTHYKDQHDSFHCPVCVKVFDNQHSRDKHVYMHRQNQHLCPDCD